MTHTAIEPHASRRATIARWSLLAALIAPTVACDGYVSESEIAQDRIIRLEAQVPTEGLLADGASILTLRVVVDIDTATNRSVAVTTSDGVLNFSANPADAAARSVSVNLAPGAENVGDGTKSIDLPMIVGRRSGSVFITATLEGVQSQVVVVLQPAPPTSILLDTSVTAMDLDGTSRADIVATLLRDSDQGQVSLGTRVLFTVCCGQANGTLAACQPRAPLRVPQIAELEQNRTIQFVAVTESIDAAEVGGPEPFDAAIVASSPAPGDPPPSCSDTSLPAARIRVTPRS